ncbi:hypothetical protein [Sphingomonas sp.]|uniref:hypothetical protein n=1 Tax=Sphingomonas sp. TaxID=28214 RepID=UPI00286E9A93|nr:hypothetical protein [Sphingomonas sp.]
MSSVPNAPPDAKAAAAGAAAIAVDGRWLPQALDAGSGLVRLVAMDAAAYRAASFLDDRMLDAPHTAHVVPWAVVAASLPADARRDARWIFHIGHVGSTLVARLLGELDGVLAVREPRILRDVAALAPEQRGTFTGPLQVLLSRTFAADQVALVKATSFVSDIAPELVAPGGKALLLFATPRNYIASILAGENSRKELALLADTRRQRLGTRGVIAPDNTANDAERAAIAWACEMTALEAAAEAIGAAHFEDFDAMLGDMPAALARTADFLGLPASQSRLEEICAGPLMRRYSKALEYEYSPALRRDLLAEAAATHRAEIDAALAMLAALADKSPLLQRALARAAGEVV